MTRDKTSTNHNKTIATWLLGCCGLVFAMVVVGAITRLTESGLSMVEWRPLIGALPPMSENEWNRVFALYQASPQFEKAHFWMELADFKRIFFWEWFHRLLGRLIGLAYGLPLAWFWIKNMIPKGYKPHLLGLLALGSAQGFMGWYMVKSGLVDIPAVSHYRLAAHLGLAFIIFANLLWTALSLNTPTKNRAQNPGIFIHGLISAALLTLTIIWGAFTAGLDAGLIYNEHFPMMTAENWLPPESLNITANHGWVQFTHRWLAVIAALGILSLGLRSRAHGLTIMVVIQIGLGISTLLSGVSLPIAAAHQAGALILLALLIKVLFKTRPGCAD